MTASWLKVLSFHRKPFSLTVDLARRSIRFSKFANGSPSPFPAPSVIRESPVQIFISQMLNGQDTRFVCHTAFRNSKVLASNKGD